MFALYAVELNNLLASSILYAKEYERFIDLFIIRGIKLLDSLRRLLIKEFVKYMTNEEEHVLLCYSVYNCWMLTEYFLYDFL